MGDEWVAMRCLKMLSVNPNYLPKCLRQKGPAQKIFNFNYYSNYLSVLVTLTQVGPTVKL